MFTVISLLWLNWIDNKRKKISKWFRINLPADLAVSFVKDLLWLVFARFLYNVSKKKSCWAIKLFFSMFGNCLEMISKMFEAIFFEAIGSYTVEDFRWCWGMLGENELKNLNLSATGQSEELELLLRCVWDSIGIFAFVRFLKYRTYQFQIWGTVHVLANGLDFTWRS